MDLKNINAPTNIITRDIREFDKKTGNLYEAVAIMSKRANQINQKLKEELYNKLKDFSSSTDTLEEIFENREQIEVSKYFERLPKPALIAIQEFLEDKIFIRKPDDNKKDEI
jgi:DNA-directed RNA polymerase subunit K/omega